MNSRCKKKEAVKKIAKAVDCFALADLVNLITDVFLKLAGTKTRVNSTFRGKERADAGYWMLETED